MILEWLEKYKFTLLNDDAKCEGEITWARDNQKSIIDYALVTDKFYDKYSKMKIDEEQEKMDISDHNLIEIHLEVEQVKKVFNQKNWITREYYKTDRDLLIVYKEALEEKVVRDGVRRLMSCSKTTRGIRCHTKPTYCAVV